MSKYTDEIVESIENNLDDDSSSLERKLRELLAAYKDKAEQLEELRLQSGYQERLLIELNEELTDHKEHLREKVYLEMQKREEKEKMLFQQSRLASMGEMMNAVAHQWKQPINVISMKVEMFGHDFEDQEVDTAYIQSFQTEMNTQINHMLTTLSTFRSFFQPCNNLKEFNVKEMFKKVLLLTQDELKQNLIDVNVHGDESYSLFGIENEFEHIVINIINNAKDAFVENNIQNRKIDIYLKEDEHYKIIEMIDNAGGIPEEILQEVFKANVSTKEEGTGIGLYMSSEIAKKHHGVLSVENTQNGAKFTFQLPRVQDKQICAI